MSDSNGEPDVYPIHSDYQLLGFVGSGGFGTVAMCKKRDTGENVAIKFSTHVKFATKEAHILEELMSHNLDQSNIVKFHGWYHMGTSVGLVLEMLDTDLTRYMQRRCLCLEEIRLFIQQLATALDGLKSIGVIHGDLKPNNVMLVKDEEQRLTLKLIDFGLAFHRSEAVVGSRHQHPYYRAPEIILGLPYDEAIDMWSLGVLLGLMMFKVLIFPSCFEYSQIKNICKVLGQPADHILDAGLKTNDFFIKNSDNKWMLKSDDEFWKNKISLHKKKAAFSSLDDLKPSSGEMKGDGEGWRQCTDLLKAMLQVDVSSRITPREVLSHPFITQSYVNSVLQPAPCEPSRSSSSRSYQDAQGDITSKWISGTLSCETVYLDPSEPEDTKEMQTLNTKLEDTTLDKSESHMEEEEGEKKKKNAFRRFFSWMKQKFSFRSYRVSPSEN